MFLCLSFFSFLTGCGSDNETFSTPPEYNLNGPSAVKLPDYLREISGLAYYPKDKSVFAIVDESAWLFKIALSGKMSIQKWKFAGKADYEDIVLADSTFYILQSNGSLVSLHFESPDSITTKEYKPNLPGQNEFEILYQDKDQNRLILLCKDCDADKKSSLTAWAFDLSSQTFSPRPAYVIDVGKIAEMAQEQEIKFKPSAAAIHPMTGQLYIISSINKMLVITDTNGAPQKIYKLNPKLYKQPEGLTFTPEGHLIISNEFASVGSADVMVFKYNQGG